MPRNINKKFFANSVHIAVQKKHIDALKVHPKLCLEVLDNFYKESTFSDNYIAAMQQISDYKVDHPTEEDIFARDQARKKLISIYLHNPQEANRDEKKAEALVQQIQNKSMAAGWNCFFNARKSKNDLEKIDLLMEAAADNAVKQDAVNALESIAQATDPILKNKARLAIDSNYKMTFKKP